MRWHQTWQLYGMIPMKHKSVLPDEGFSTRRMPLNSAGQTFIVYCEPKAELPEGQVRSWRNKSSKHRVFAICDCGRHVPFGRMGQHYTVKCSEAK